MPIMWYNMGEWFYGTLLVQDGYFFILVYRQTKITSVSSHFLSILHSSQSLREVKYFLLHFFNNLHVVYNNVPKYLKHPYLLYLNPKKCQYLLFSFFFFLLIKLIAFVMRWSLQPSNPIQYKSYRLCQ